MRVNRHKRKRKATVTVEIFDTSDERERQQLVAALKPPPGKHWLPPLVTTIGYHHWLPPLVTSTGYHHWLPPLVTTAGYHHWYLRWLPLLVTTTGYHHWLPLLVTTTVDRRTEEGGRFFGTFTLCNNNNNKEMKEILPQTRHTIHMVINMSFFFPF